MNAFINIKTAEKGLQCKTMLVGKTLKMSLIVDTWSVVHKEKCDTGDTDLIEKYPAVQSRNTLDLQYLILVAIWPILEQ